MKSNQYPTASEVRYKNILDDIYEKIDTSRDGFIDITLSNSCILDFLKEKGFLTFRVMYEYNENREYGYFGRTKGDGHVLMRIIWDSNIDFVLETYGDFR